MGGFTLEQVRGIAEKHDFSEISLNMESRVISFRKESARINVYYTTGTVGTCLNHPTRGKTQLFRRNISLNELEALFQNPRSHTGRGYYYRQHLNQEWRTSHQDGSGKKAVSDMARRWIYVALMADLTDNSKDLNSLELLMNRISQILWEPGSMPDLSETKYSCGSQTGIVQMALNVSMQDGAIGACRHVDLEAFWDGGGITRVPELESLDDCRQCGALDAFMEAEQSSVALAEQMLRKLPKKLRKTVCDWLIGLLHCGFVLVDEDYNNFTFYDDVAASHVEYSTCFYTKSQMNRMCPIHGILFSE
jgi:hypothetical protein